MEKNKLSNINDKISKTDKRRNAVITDVVEKSSNNSNDIDKFITVKQKRNKRVSYAITEETDRKLKKKCKQLGISANEVVNQLLDNFVSEID